MLLEGKLSGGPELYSFIWILEWIVPCLTIYRGVELMRGGQIGLWGGKSYV